MIPILLSVAFAAELGFGEAIKIALAEGAAARIVAAEAAGERAGARAEAAWIGNPELMAERKSGEATILLTVPLEFGAPARAGAAADAIAAANIRENAGRSAVACAAAAAFLDALRARELGSLAEDARGMAERLQTSSDARFAAGEVSSSEHALLLADAARALDTVLSLERDSEAAARRLGVLVGAPESDRTEVSGWPDLAVPTSIDADRLPAVLVADLEARAALQRLHAASLSLIPALSVSGGWVVEGPAGPAYGASLTLPLFAPGVTRVQTARAASDASDAAATLMHLSGTATLADAERELEIATQVAAAWEIAGLGGALDAAAHRYEAGESSLAAFVTERDLALGALQSSVDSHWRLQRARLALWELAGEVPVEISK